jgi:hypothetical protein
MYLQPPAPVFYEWKMNWKQTQVRGMLLYFVQGVEFKPSSKANFWGLFRRRSTPVSGPGAQIEYVSGANSLNHHRHAVPTFAFAMLRGLPYCTSFKFIPATDKPGNHVSHT